MTCEMTWERQGDTSGLPASFRMRNTREARSGCLATRTDEDLRYIINDLREMEGYSVTREQLEYLAAFNRASSYSNPEVRIAYVTTDLKIILLLKAAALVSTYPLKAFSTPEAAREWAAEGSPQRQPRSLLTWAGIHFPPKALRRP